MWPVSATPWSWTPLRGDMPRPVRRGRSDAIGGDPVQLRHQRLAIRLSWCHSTGTPARSHARSRRVPTVRRMHMKREILINATQRETRVAIIEDDQLVELLFDRPDNRRMVGDIYLGKVEKVLPGIQAAFVQIGTEKGAFLHASDLVVDEEVDEDADDDEGNGNGGGGRRNGREA